ncbi:hypothetical protein [Streptomyces sp. NPDC004267]|uniref:hypothetical protein n=1 Tax=Streptomyces sp. NPDC004267 TaxID=3364694 RepID=UPI0036C90F7C
MTTETRQPLVPRSVGLAVRVTTLLARTFPEYSPGEGHDGFRVVTIDRQEPRRMCVRWYDGTPARPASADVLQKVQAQIVETLTREGYAVTSVPGREDVFVNDRPVDASGPRFAPVASDIPFSAPWLVMDTWTRVHIGTAASERHAAAGAMRAERRHVLADARMVTSPDLHEHLVRADKTLGDGVTWLRRELDMGDGHPEPVQRDRLDALVDVAKALRRGDDVGRSGPMVTYVLGRGVVQWAPKANAPSVGFFPKWARTADMDAAIALLLGAELHPVVYGVELGEGGVMVEASGFMVSPPHLDWSGRGVHLSEIGSEHLGEIERAAETLRTAGWKVEADPVWTGWYEAFPPAE